MARQAFDELEKLIIARWVVPRMTTSDVDMVLHREFLPPGALRDALSQAGAASVAARSTSSETKLGTHLV